MVKENKTVLSKLVLACFLNNPYFLTKPIKYKLMGSTKPTYDLVIAGTGFASTFFLKKYLEKKGNANKKILVIERGQLFPYKDRLAFAQGKNPVYLDKIESHDDSFVNTNKAKPWLFDLSFGGSSNCWWGCTPRFMPNDFAMKTRYDQAIDWPITYKDIEPYYCEAEKIINISGPVHTPFPRSKPYPLPAHALSTIDKKMQKAHGDIQWISQPAARASQTIETRNACCSSYTCNLCPANAKFTIENGLYKTVYTDPRIELREGLQVYKVEFEGNVAKRVLCVNRQHPDLNNPIVFEGDIIALGTNAIFNAHILLNSGDKNPFTGKGLSEQCGFFADIHIGTVNVGGGSSISANGYMQYDGDFRKNSASVLIENHNQPVIRNERGKWRNIARLKFVLENIPDLANNKVLLSDDPLKPRVEYKELNDYVINGRKRIEGQLEKIFEPLEIEEVMVEEAYTDTECHLLSSVRMGKDANESVVDKYMIHHQYRNLFVLGGSSFPTISAANPTLTISALSLMAADANFS